MHNLKHLPAASVYRMNYEPHSPASGVTIFPLISVDPSPTLHNNSQAATLLTSSSIDTLRS